MEAHPYRMSRSLHITAWVVTLLLSALPGALWAQFTGSAAPQWFYYVRIGLPLLLIFVAELLPALQPLRIYFLLLAVVNLGFWLVGVVRRIPAWHVWEVSTPWMTAMIGIQLLEVAAALLVLGALFLTLRKRSLFLFARGELNAEAQTVPWIGMSKPTPWKTFGLIICLASFFGAILFLWISNRPTAEMWSRLLPALPGVILLSLINSLDEEIIFRNGLLAPLAPVLGNTSALWLTALFFGIGHYSGTFPGGLIWLLLTSFFGFLFGKSMLETKGLAWPWLLHFISDLPVFAFTAMVYMR